MLPRFLTATPLSRLFAAAALVGGMVTTSTTHASEPMSTPVTLAHLLSGEAPNDNVTWQFARGLFAETSELPADVAWESIRVPSNWELEGQGSYSYGRGADRKDAERKRLLADVGTYRHVFAVPQRLKAASAQPSQQRRFFLRFDGVMTDARVFFNGQQLVTTDGQTEHRGGFVPFEFEVTNHLILDGPNELVVAVREESANDSVNRAERDADYWLFGGIFRPVALLSKPLDFLESVVVDARADGHLLVQADVNFTSSPERLVAPWVQVVVKNTRNPRAVRTIADTHAEVDGAGRATIKLRLKEPRPWSAKNPNLYELDVRLKSRHRVVIPFGFRTVEVRTGSQANTARDASNTGLFVNGERVILRGVNRHSFWPDTGRALTAEQNRRDVELIKELGFNAVRSSHYPPDSEFLRACDELGLYVIDELPGWHDAYDTATAKRLARVMVKRDHNHPSILLWANGNEGGWNPAAEPVFRELDLQQRPVIRPDAIRGGFDTRHYPTWAELETLLDEDSPRYRFHRPLQPPPLIMPTEMLHGLFDGGGAAGLERYWSRLSASPRFAGGFLWALLDEGVRRVDQPKEPDHNDDLRHPIDTAGSYAPDGILGPYREPTASSRGVAELFVGRQSSAPAADTEPYPELFVPEEIQGRDPKATMSELAVTLSTDAFGTTVSPVKLTITRVPVSDQSSGVPAEDVLNWGITSLYIQDRAFPIRGGEWRSSTSTDARRLVGEELVAANGRRQVLGDHQPWPGDDVGHLQGVVQYTQTFNNPTHAVRWTLSSQTLDVRARGIVTEDANWAGLNLALPQDTVVDFKWKGLGPDRVWRNRRTGREDHWHAAFGDAPNGLGTVASLTSGARFDALPLAGVYALREAELNLQASEGTHRIQIFPGSSVVSRSKSALEATKPGGHATTMTGLLRPTFPEGAAAAAVALPSGLTVYARAPGIGTKFYSALELEPPLETFLGEASLQLRFQSAADLTETNPQP